MNSLEFEAAIQGRVVCPKSAVQYSAILFQTEYPPEEMVKKMNSPGNATQLMDKQKNGAGIWKYFCNTMTGGYIFCIVNDNPPTTGEQGDFMDMPEIPEAIKNVAMHAVSGFLLGFSATFVVAPQNWAELSTAIYAAAVVGFYGALKEVMAYALTIANKNTKAGQTETQKPLIERML
jgi:hypothetical protein